MPAKKLPDTDEKRMQALKTLLEQEESAENAVLLPMEIRDLQNFLIAYEGDYACLEQARNNETSAAESYQQLFRNVQLYVSHFIQVLHLATIRREVKPENLAFYGLSYAGDDLTLPDLSTEEAVLAWSEHLIAGEAERIALGGTAIYNPPITKVKVHYDLFKEAVYSLNIYRKNTVRMQERLEDRRDRADSLLWTAWTKIEFASGHLSPDERNRKYQAYGIHFYHNEGEQLNVFG
jgi:hypothetical protein